MADTTNAPAPPTDTAGTITHVTTPSGAPLPATAGSSPDFMQFLPLIAIFAVFYFLIIRPQQQQMKAHRDAMSALKKGDRVVTGGGIIGTVVHAPEGATEITVDLNDTTRVTVLRTTITSVVKPETANDDTAKKAA
jgi:preprotein translocase subunit YajC